MACVYSSSKQRASYMKHKAWREENGSLHTILYWESASVCGCPRRCQGATAAAMPPPELGGDMQGKPGQAAEHVQIQQPVGGSPRLAVLRDRLLVSTVRQPPRGAVAI